MNIPKKLTVGDTQYRVMQERTLGVRKVLGQFLPKARVIQVRTYYNGRKVEDDRLYDTFWHETVHAILHDMGHPLNYDEEFVDALAVRIAQVIRTSEV